MIKTVEELKAQAIKENIFVWPYLDCGICGFWCKWLIHGDIVLYDSACDCVYRAIPLRPSTWEDVAEAYNRNQPENNPEIDKEYLDRLNQTWKFPA